MSASELDLATVVATDVVRTVDLTKTYAGTDFEENELHAVGQTCARCGRAIAAGEEVRRTASGGYQHEYC